MNPIPSFAEQETSDEVQTDFLRPEQRLALIAEVLADIALRLVRENSEM